MTRERSSRQRVEGGGFVSGGFSGFAALIVVTLVGTPTDSTSSHLIIGHALKQELHFQEEALEHGTCAGVTVTQMSLKSCRRGRRHVEVSTSISWSVQFGAT